MKFNPMVTESNTLEGAKKPRVSVCLPNLNNRPYLEDRLDSIFAQSFSDWELVIFDNHSDDGAWQLFQEVAAKDERVRLERAPRRGMYANWNNCIQAARGDYVYIATSDDTMAEDCLDKMVAALDADPECDLAHCTLREINEHGCEWHNWWPSESTFALSSGDLLYRPHVRRAPVDGLLHLCGNSVYTSITQLLIRRSLFDRVGLFESRWGSIGDFNWDMRAGLSANTVHVPDTWASWRKHSSQATALAGLGGLDHLGETDAMIEHALLSAKEELSRNIGAKRLRKLVYRMHDLRHLIFDVRARPDLWSRRLFLVRRLLSGSWAARWHVAGKIKAQRGVEVAHPPRLIVDWLNDEGIGQVLIPLNNSERAEVSNHSASPPIRSGVSAV